MLSGSLCGWGDPLIGRFSLVVFLSLPADVRLARLRAGEAQRYGPAGIAAGGSLHAQFQRFMDWAARYDEGDLSLRSRQLHEAWLAGLPCPVVRLGRRMLDRRADRDPAADVGGPWRPDLSHSCRAPLPPRLSRCG